MKLAEDLAFRMPNTSAVCSKNTTVSHLPNFNADLITDNKSTLSANEQLHAAGWKSASCLYYIIYSMQNT